MITREREAKKERSREGVARRGHDDDLCAQRHTPRAAQQHNTTATTACRWGFGVCVVCVWCVCVVCACVCVCLCECVCACVRACVYSGLGGRESERESHRSTSHKQARTMAHLAGRGGHPSPMRSEWGHLDDASDDRPSGGECRRPLDHELAAGARLEEVELPLVMLNVVAVDEHENL